MKYNITFVLTGPSGHVVEAPNTSNPVECANMASLLAQLASNLPQAMGVEVIGIHVERLPEIGVQR